MAERKKGFYYFKWSLFYLTSEGKVVKIYQLKYEYIFTSRESRHRSLDGSNQHSRKSLEATIAALPQNVDGSGRGR